jgi:actin-related protein 6
MNNERITVPEVLFHPSDIGVNQAGIVETILQSISATCADMRPALFSNILLIGGNAAFPGFKERLETELRMIAPWNTEVTIYTPEELSTSLLFLLLLLLFPFRPLPYLHT